MMTSPSELSLDSKPSAFAILSRSSGDRDPTMEQAQKLEEFLARLEEERLKIDAFKRELPLCMQLLNNAMEASREQLQSQRTASGQGPSSRPVLEEFIPLKNPNNCSDADQIENTENTSADKANWMTHAQLWNQESQEIKPSQTPLPSVAPQETEIKLALNGKQRTINNGGAFHPFSTKDRVSLSAFPELALAPSHKEEMEEAKINALENSERRENSAGNNNTVVEKEQAVGNNTNSTQPHRKARRCWSPDLHRRFVNALHMLGGSQVATPKQIRELMKVDGLTNDEVKSHLQKYRLHTRRPSPSPQATVPATPQVVVLGGIWVQPEYAAAAAYGAPPPPAAFYSPHAHHISPPLISPPPENNLCPVIGRPPPPPPPSQIPNAHHQLLHMYNNNATNINRAASFITHGGSSDDVRSSDVQGGNISGCDDDRHEPNSESIGDEKSESGSWKAESDHHHHHHQNGSRRVVAADNEESNASVVSLNF